MDDGAHATQLQRSEEAADGSHKELIDEEFGDAMTSAIDFDIDLSREPNPAGDRLRIVMTGKCLAYRTF